MPSRLTDRLAEVKTDVKAALSELPLLEAIAGRAGRVDLGPLEDSLRRAIRAVGQLRLTGDDARPGQAEWWECGDCRSKLAAVTGQTVTIVRKDLTVHVARLGDPVVIVACPRCHLEQQFVR